MPVNVVSLVETLAANMPSLDTLKSGWKTSEFWISTMTAVLGGLTATGILAPAGIISVIAGGVLALAATLSYNWHRGKLKAVVASASDAWALAKNVSALAHHGALTPISTPYTSTATTIYMPPASRVPGAVPQAVDEDPKAYR